MKKLLFFLATLILVGAVIISVVIIQIIISKNKKPPEEMLMGAAPESTHLLWDGINISYYIGATDDSIMYYLYEVEFEDGSPERRGYLSVNEGEQLIYLGALEHQLPGTPLEMQFIEIAKFRFIIYWVDDSIKEDIASVTFARPYYPERKSAIDDTIKISGANKRGGIIPLYPHSSFNLWKKLESITIYSLGSYEDRQTFEIPYEPPLSIDDLFQEYDLDINLLYHSVRFRSGYSFWFHGGDVDMQITVDQFTGEPKNETDASIPEPTVYMTLLYDPEIIIDNEYLISETISLTRDQAIERGGYRIEVLSVNAGQYVQDIYLKVIPEAAQ